MDESYRLAVLGNLTSAELRAAGYPGNNALRDKKCALQWVKKYIAGFGGDADNVTAFGVSAGSGNLPTLSLGCGLISSSRCPNAAFLYRTAIQACDRYEWDTADGQAAVTICRGDYVRHHHLRA